MAFITGEDLEHVKHEFAGLEFPVKLIYFTQHMECSFCRDTHALLDEIAGLSDKISLEVYDFEKHADKVKEYRIDKIPAIAVIGERDYGVRFYGIPAGYEFISLMEAVKSAGTRKTTLSDTAKYMLAGVAKPVHIQVFVSLTCPYCPATVGTAHAFAFENDNIRADMVEISEFAHLSNKYDVFSVPKVVINESVEFEGALPEDLFLEKVMEAAK